MKQRTYIAIDLKSFYASVECRDRGLDPLDTNLVVADESRTDKTICLAVTPSLKSYGISGRGRLFEVKQRVKEAAIAVRDWVFRNTPFNIIYSICFIQTSRPAERQSLTDADRLMSLATN